MNQDTLAATPASGTLPHPVAAPQTGWRAWQQPALLALATVAGMRLLLSGWAAIVLAAAPAPNLQQQYAYMQFPLQGGWLAGPWEQQDALWYEKIAAEGYTPANGSGGFFPLMAVAVRMMSVVTGGNLALAGLLVGSLAAVVTFALLYRLVDRDFGPTTAGRTLAYMAVFPMAFFLYSGFTESLFLALTLGAFWCARSGRWPVVVGLSFLAGLTKLQGVLLGLPLAVEYLQAGGWRAARPFAFPPRRLPGLAAIGAAGALGTGAFFAYLAYVIRDPHSYTEHQFLTYGYYLSWPGETLGWAIHQILGERGLTINQFDLAMLLLFTGLACAAFRLRLSYGIQALSILFFIWFHVRAQIPLMSASRYVLVAFPCFLVLAQWAGRRRRWAHLLIITLSLSWMLVWVIIFIHGHWVG